MKGGQQIDYQVCGRKCKSLEGHKTHAKIHRNCVTIISYKTMSLVCQICDGNFKNLLA